MTALAFSRNAWTELDQDENRFQRTLLTTAIPFLLLCIAIPLWELSGLKEGGGEELSDRYAQLLMQSAQRQAEKPEPEPAAVEEPEVAEEPEEEPAPEQPEQVEEPQPETQPEQTPVEPEPQVDERTQARENVKRRFAAQFDALSELRETPVVTGRQKPLTSATSSSAEPSQSSSNVLTSNLASGSGGIGTAKPRRSDTPSTGLSGRQSTQVDGQITASGGGFGADSDEAGFGGNSRDQARSLEEIQIVMDRNKSGLYSLYNRALRKNATLQGKVVIEMTIAPSGEVTNCNIVSSELRDDALEQRILRRVRLINFGAKDVSAMTIKYPIHFIPS